MMTLEQAQALITKKENVKLSKYFWLTECVKSGTATRNGVDNWPIDPQVILNIEALAVNCLDAIREKFGSFTPNSVYRSYDLEKIICKKEIAEWLVKHPDKNLDDYLIRKQHPRGNAADIEIPDVVNKDLFQWCKTNLNFDQLIAEFMKDNDPTAGWVHVSFVSEKDNRKQELHIG